MKIGIIKLSMAMFIISMASSCDDIVGHKDSPVDQLTVPNNPPLNFSVTGCKSTGLSNMTGFGTEETIEYEGRENNLLRITHNNVIFNCTVLQIYAEMTVDNNTYIIEEKSQEGSISANCFCPYDMGYDIGPLKEGEEYKVNIRRGSSEKSEIAKFTFTYSRTIKGSISIK